MCGVYLNLKYLYCNWNVIECNWSITVLKKSITITITITISKKFQLQLRQTSNFQLQLQLQSNCNCNCNCDFKYNWPQPWSISMAGKELSTIVLWSISGPLLTLTFKPPSANSIETPAQMPLCYSEIRR